MDWKTLSLYVFVYDYNKVVQCNYNLKSYIVWMYRHLNDEVRWKAAYFYIKGTDPLTKIVLELTSDW